MAWYDKIDDVIDKAFDLFGDNKDAIGAGLGALLPLLGLTGSNTQPVGYQGKIEKIKANREQAPYDYQTEAMTRGVGDLGRRYFSDTVYSLPKGVQKDQDDVPVGLQIPTYEEADAFVNQQAQDIVSGTPLQDNPFSTPLNYGYTPTSSEVQQSQNQYNNDFMSRLLEKLAEYGITEDLGQIPRTDGFAQGGLASMQPAQGYYLGGVTDGMADQIPANIGGSQEAALSDGEFVVPADVVSHLGNGNSNAGAKELYDMMDRIRQARTGQKSQGSEIKPNKFLPN